MKRIYLHIGFGKTGTSAVQEFFFQNRGAFLRQGLDYPLIGLTPYAHHGLALFQSPEMPEGVAGLYEQLVKAMRASPSDNFLLSSEQFCFLRPAYVGSVKKHLAEFDVKVIFYARNQIKLIESTYLEWQKVGAQYHDNIGAFFKKTRNGFDFELRLAPWVKEFGRDNVVVRIYDRRVIGSDTSADIMKIMGLSLAEDVGNANLRSNHSLLPQFSRLVTEIDAAGVSPEARKKILFELLRLSLNLKPSSGTSLIDDELRASIQAQYRDSNKRLADTYLSETEAAIFLGNQTE